MLLKSYMYTNATDTTLSY